MLTKSQTSTIERISLEESKEHLKKFNLTDKQIEDFRNAAYSIVNDILDELYEKETDN